MLRSFLAAIACFVLICSLSAQQVMTPTVGAKPLTPSEQELVDQVKQLNQQAWHRNTDYVKQTVAPDFVDVDPSGNASDRAELLTEMQVAARSVPPEKAAQLKSWLYDFKVVPINDGAAIVTYNAVLPFGMRYQHVSSIWVKQDGQWKLKFRQASPNRWSADDF
jgi:hypothetical protein